MSRSPGFFFFGNKEITALHIEGCLKLESLKGIEKLREIKEIVILGAGASSPTINSLKPLKSLINLTYFRIYAKVKDASLAPLVGLKELALLDLPNRFSTHDYEQILLHSPNSNRSDPITACFIAKKALSAPKTKKQ